MKKLISVIIIILAIIFTGCDNSVDIKDGFTVSGEVIDNNSGVPISGVIISSYFDSSQIEKTDLAESDINGQFTIYFGPATAPSDEIIAFEHNDYFLKEIQLREEVTQNDNRYRLLVSLSHK